MLININKNNELINDYSEDKEIYEIKIVDDLPNDINEYFYKYIGGKLVRGKEIDFNYKSQEVINEEQSNTNDEQDAINIDFEYRISVLELGM